jgi:hypothetical protein
MTEGNFDLVCGQEPTWASMLAMPKSDLLRSGRGKLPEILIPWLLSQAQESKCVKFVRVREYVRIPGRVTGHSEPGASGDVEPVR